MVVSSYTYGRSVLLEEDYNLKALIPVDFHPDISWGAGLPEGQSISVTTTNVTLTLR